ncbi:MAG: formylmethanofuran--tetrahydromethanopterin N-formyltransferase, partial [Planctomycetales bacterium]
MKINGTEIVDTFAEAFPVVGARVVVTAVNRQWSDTVAHVATGYATSIISCDCEAGVERNLEPDETPDGRPGVSLLFFSFGRKGLAKALANRVGQCVLTCPTTACYDGLREEGREVPKDDRLRVGGTLRYFGDSFQVAKRLERRRFWRIPTMDGEFLCEDSISSVKGVGGGNFLIIGASQQVALEAAERAVRAVREI